VADTIKYNSEWANTRMNASQSNNEHHAGRKYAPGIDLIFCDNGQHRAPFECTMLAFFFVLYILS